MIGRRGFLGALAGALLTPTSAFTKLVEWPRPAIRIVQRKIMGRIRITGEVMRDCHEGAFTAAAREEYTRVAQDIMFREEREWL